MGYIMNIFIDDIDDKNRIRFAYKIKNGEGLPNKDIQLVHFKNECIRLAKYQDFCMHRYIFMKQIYISGIGLVLRNLFHSIDNKIVIVPSWGSIARTKEYFYYTFKPGDNWYCIAKTICGDGKKANELLQYNCMKETDARLKLKIKIPFYLINTRH